MKSSKSAGRVGRNYRRKMAVRAPVERLFDAVATPDGVRGWWTRLVSGSSDRGAALRLDFEGMDEHIDLRVVRSRRPTEVEWRIIEHTSLEEWAGTRIRFEVSGGDAASTLVFEHVGLSPKLECYDQCEAGWGHFLDSLVAFAERGQGMPFRASGM